MERDRIEDLLKGFKHLDCGERARFIRKLIKKISKNPTELTFIRSLLSQIPESAALDSVPVEVLPKIFSFLDLNSLGVVGRVNRKFLNLVTGDLNCWRGGVDRMQLQDTLTIHSSSHLAKFKMTRAVIWRSPPT